MLLFIKTVVEWRRNNIFVCCKENWSLDKFDGTFYLSYTHEDMSWFKTVSGILGLNVYFLSDIV